MNLMNITSTHGIERPEISVIIMLGYFSLSHCFICTLYYRGSKKGKTIQCCLKKQCLNNHNE